MKEVVILQELLLEMSCNFFAAAVLGEPAHLTHHDLMRKSMTTLPQL